MSEIDPIGPGGDDPSGEESLLSGDSRRVGAMVGAALLGLIVVWLILNSAIVPNTVGMSSERARKLVAEAGFESEVETEAAGLRPSNRVIEQKPSGGIRLRFFPVEMVVTSGGLSGALRDRGLEPVPYRNYDLSIRDFAPTQVMPNDADEVDPLFVPSIDQDPVMPNVLNKTSSSALRTLRAAGLRVSTKSGGSTTNVAKGRIYYQDPPPGTLISPGDSALVWISTGPFDIISGKDTQYPYPRPVEPLP